MRKQIRILVCTLIVAGIGLALTGCASEPVSQPENGGAARTLGHVSKGPTYGGQYGISNGE